MSGFFVQEAATCFVALMIIEKSDPEAELTATATRVRLVLNPGQIAGLDSEEGYSVTRLFAGHARPSSRPLLRI